MGWLAATHPHVRATGLLAFLLAALGLVLLVYMLDRWRPGR
jgi:hypothetical protein